MIGCYLVHINLNVLAHANISICPMQLKWSFLIWSLRKNRSSCQVSWLRYEKCEKKYSVHVQLGFSYFLLFRAHLNFQFYLLFQIPHYFNLQFSLLYGIDVFGARSQQIFLGGSHLQFYNYNHLIYNWQSYNFICL